MLLPLILLQAPVLAQTESAPEVNEQKPVPAVVAQITTPDPAPKLLPLKGTEQIRLQLVNWGAVRFC